MGGRGMHQAVEESFGPFGVSFTDQAVIHQRCLGEILMFSKPIKKGTNVQITVNFCPIRGSKVGCTFIENLQSTAQQISCLLSFGRFGQGCKAHGEYRLKTL